MADWIQTYTGRRVDPLGLRPGDVCLKDIAHALSNTCRFNGHCRGFYSVAEHSVRALRFARLIRGDRDACLPAVLLHDAAEAYLGDVVTPIKRRLDVRAAGPAVVREMANVEASVLHGVFSVLGLTHDHVRWPLIRQIDRVLLATEARDLMGGPSDWPCLSGVVPLPETIEPWQPLEAKRSFLLEAKKLGLFNYERARS